MIGPYFQLMENLLEYGCFLQIRRKDRSNRRSFFFRHLLSDQRQPKKDDINDQGCKRLADNTQSRVSSHCVLQFINYCLVFLSGRTHFYRVWF